MSHVIVKLWPGKSEQRKARLTEAVTKEVMLIFNYGAVSLAVAMKEIGPQHWAEQVCKPDNLDPPGRLYKRPGCTM